MAVKYSTSAALQFTEQELGGPCVEYETYPTCQTSPMSLVHGSGDRVGLIIINLGLNPVNIGLFASITATNGILLAPQGGLVSMTVRDDFTLPSREWWGIATGGTSQLYILEVVRFTYNEEVP